MKTSYRDEDERLPMPHFSVPTEAPVELDAPDSSDGAAMWALADRADLDVNAPYQYLLWCRDFAATSVVARHRGSIVGFVTGYRRPEAPDVLFVWQVAVDPAWGRRGLGTRMVRDVAVRPAPLSGGRPARWVEATVTPRNVASDRLFRRVAADASAGVVTAPQFSADAFPVDHVSPAACDEHEGDTIAGHGFVDALSLSWASSVA